MSINVKFVIISFFLLVLVGTIKVNAGIITYNGIENISRVLYYNGTNTSLVNHQTNYQIFRNNVAVGDLLYFGWSGGTWNNLTLNIVSPVTATNFGVVWQYYDFTSANWKNISGVIDNTNNFTSSGINTVSFEVPSNWGTISDFYNPSSFPNKTYTTARTHYYIRARVIVSDTPISGGTAGANQTTLRDNTITVTGTQNYIENISTQDALNNWGVVTKLNSYYFINANLKVGNSTNSPHELTVRNFQIVELGNLSRRVLLRVINSNSSLILGNINSNNETYESSYFKYWNSGEFSSDAGAYNYLYNLHVYSSVFLKNTGGYADATYLSPEFYDSIFQTTSPHTIFISQTTGIDAGTIKNSQIATGAGAWFYQYSSAIKISNLVISRGLGILTGVSSSVSDTDFGTSKNFIVANSGNTATCLNCKFNNVSSQLQAAAPNTNTANYTLTIDVYNKTGERIFPNVTIIDSLGRTQFNGVWTNSTSVQTYKIVVNASGTFRYDYSPFTIILQNQGMVNYFQKQTINFDNKYLSLTMGYYPFEVNGTLVLSQGKGLRFFR